MKNYYEYFDSMSLSELEAELNLIEENKLSITGESFVDEDYIISLKIYLEDKGYFE